MQQTPLDSAPPVRTAPQEEILCLLRRLVQQIDLFEQPANEHGEQTLLDVRLNEFRYILLRQRSYPSSRTLNLSPRELEIARMVAEGHSNKIIAAVLDISSWTVCTHLRRLFAKLNVSSRAAMVARVLEAGFIDRDRSVRVKPVAGLMESTGGSQPEGQWKDVRGPWEEKGNEHLKKA